MATYLAHDALRLPAASLLANSGVCVNIEIKIWLLLGVNVDTAYFVTSSCESTSIYFSDTEAVGLSRPASVFPMKMMMY